MSRQAVSLCGSSWISSAPSYADGIAYATSVGLLDDERVIVEVSSGALTENIQHTLGDSLKLLESLTCIIVLKASKFSNAKFTTLQRYKAIGIHVIKRTITMSVLAINDDKKFVLEERRAANVPIHYQERYEWLSVFELLAHLDVSHVSVNAVR